MKQLLPRLLTFACLLAACSKNDSPEDMPPPVEKEWLLDHMVSGEDSIQLVYHADGSVKQFARFSLTGGWNDSTLLEYTNGKITKFLLYEEEGTTRTDRAFMYAGDELRQIDFYNFISGDEVAVTDHDSLVYANGRLAECHHINGTFRNSFSVYTWENGNIIKEEQFSVINDQPVPDAVISYTYNDKPGLSESVKHHFIFFLKNDYTCLSKNALVKAEITYLPADEPHTRKTVEYTYNTEGLLSRTVLTEEALAGGAPVKHETSYTFIVKQ